MESHLNLATIPTDVVELIAYHAVANDFLGPPHVLVALTSTCRSLHYSLSLENNHSLHADIFRFKFDSTAAYRRFARTEPWRVSASGLAAELRARFTALRYMRQVVLLGDRSRHPEKEVIRHLWTLYFMCIESDGKNANQLLFYGKLRPYIQICLTQYLLPVLRTGDYLPETVDRSLILWMLWLSTTWDSLNDESADHESDMISLLRPIVYANFNFNAYFAPWMIYQLPTRQSRSENRDSSSWANDHSLNRYSAEMDPVDRSITINLYGSLLRLTPPVLVHGAMLSYFARLERRSVYEAAENINIGLHADYLPHSSQLTMRLPDMQDSRLYDADFYRLRICQDPYSSSGIANILASGVFSGDWEGYFAFTDFDSFRDMLDGDDNAIHTATIAVQPQVWTIKEHHYQPRIIAPLHDSTSQRRNAETTLRRTIRPVPPGPSLAAHLPNNLELTECIPVVGSPKCSYSGSGSPSSSTSKNPNPHSHIGPMLHATYTNPASGTRVRATYTTWTDGVIPEPPSRIATQNDFSLRSHSDRFGNSGNSPSLRMTSADTANQCLLLEPSVDIDSSGQELAECAGLKDIILTGKGYSAWGPFVLKGRVRLWDGMVNIVKTYATDDGRGAWLYRGYILSNGLWIGRWRDTMTEEDTNGYEGVFAMTRRNDPLAGM